MEKKSKYNLKLKWKISILIVLAFALLFLWARFIGTSGLEVKEYKVVNSSLPASFYGLKIVHFSDLHYGRTIKEKEFDNVVNKIDMIKPDIVVFSGDFVDKNIKLTSSMKNILIKELSKIHSTYGNYFVTGNHDKYFKDYKDIMEQGDFIDLDDKYDIIYSKKNESIFIGGMSSFISTKPVIKNIENYFKNNKDIPKYRIFVMHVPDDMDYIKNYNFNLVLAGHSHNGQVRLPFIGAIVKPLGAKEYYDAYYKVGNTDFYISSGLGTSTLDVRLFDKPSFNLYRLVNK